MYLFRIKNESLQHNNSMDKYPKALVLLTRTGYIAINPDRTDEEIVNVSSIISKSV